MLQKGYMILKKKNSTNFEENLLFSGIVSHERIKPFKHSFKYNVTYFWFDINISEKYKLLKKNKLSLFSFFDKDHGPVKPKVECLYRYLTRTIGYVFNPISVFLIYDYKNIPVRIVFEVSNTFGERHAYVCKVNTKGVYYLNKVLYVSPFFKTEGKYKIQFNIKKKVINLLIFYNVNNIRVFKASFIGNSKKMSEFNLLTLFFSNMFQNFKVTFGIYIQALKLWLKGAKYINKPNKPKNFITRI